MRIYRCPHEDIYNVPYFKSPMQVNHYTAATEYT